MSGLPYLIYVYNSFGNRIELMERKANPR